MDEGNTFQRRIAALREEVRQLGDDFDQRCVEETASRLEGIGYAPPVITSIDVFLRMDREGLLHEIDHILSLPESEACALTPDNSLCCEDLRLQYISVLIYYYRKLLDLRSGNAEEWDEIDELYIHD